MLFAAGQFVVSRFQGPVRPPVPEILQVAKIELEEAPVTQVAIVSEPVKVQQDKPIFETTKAAIHVKPAVARKLIRAQALQKVAAQRVSDLPCQFSLRQWPRRDELVERIVNRANREYFRLVSHHEGSRRNYGRKPRYKDHAVPRIISMQLQYIEC